MRAANEVDISPYYLELSMQDITFEESNAE